MFYVQPTLLGPCILKSTVNMHDLGLADSAHGLHHQSFMIFGMLELLEPFFLEFSPASMMIKLLQLGSPCSGLSIEVLGDGPLGL